MECGGGLWEPLGERELAVLGLIVAGYANKEIAEDDLESAKTELKEALTRLPDLKDIQDNASIGQREIELELKQKYTFIADLIYFDGPLLSLFENSHGDLYLYYWCDHGKWL